MLKKVYKPSRLSLICAAVLFTGVCAVFGAGVNLGYIDYHPMDFIAQYTSNLSEIDYHPMKVIFQYIPNIL